MKDGIYSKNELNRMRAKSRRGGQLCSDQIMSEAKRKSKSKVLGPREKFLAKYRVEGFEEAKRVISDYGYGDEILNKWIEELTN